MKHDEVLFHAILRQDFLSFVAKAFATLSPGATFSRNWHHEAIAWQLERMAAGDVTRLIVTLPPRQLKSIMISVAWVAWMLGHDPAMRFMCISYNSDLAGKFARDCRLLMQEDWYRATFPHTVLDRAAEADLQTTSGGGRFSTSIGGTLTGRGADVIIIDDPLKADEAMSATARAAVNEWISGTLLSRLNDKKTGRILLVMQRLHDEDLAGMLLGAGGWDHLNLPAVAEQDEQIAMGPHKVHQRLAEEVLHAEREPLDILMKIKATMGSAAFSAQYQQAPVPASGNLIDPAWLQRYEEAPTRQRSDRVVQSWDTASKEGALNDHSVCITALVRKDQVWVLDVFRRRLKFPDLLRQVRLQAERYDADVLLIEDAASGQQLIQMLQHSPVKGVPRPIACKPDGDKVTRMSAASSMIEAGGLLLPREAPWLAELERELFAFPCGRHDDQVDALSQLLAWAAKRPKLRLISPWIGDPQGPEVRC